MSPKSKDTLRSIYTRIRTMYDVVSHVKYIYKIITVFPFGITVWNPDTMRFEFVNSTIIRESGYTRQELTTGYGARFAVDAERTRIEVEKVGTKAVIEHMESPRHFPNKWYHADGSILNMSWLSVAVDRKIVSVVMISKC